MFLVFLHDVVLVQHQHVPLFNTFQNENPNWILLERLRPFKNFFVDQLASQIMESSAARVPKTPPKTAETPPKTAQDSSQDLENNANAPSSVSKDNPVSSKDEGGGPLPASLDLAEEALHKNDDSAEAGPPSDKDPSDREETGGGTAAPSEQTGDKEDHPSDAQTGDKKDSSDAATARSDIKEGSSDAPISAAVSAASTTPANRNDSTNTITSAAPDAGEPTPAEHDQELKNPAEQDAQKPPPLFPSSSEEVRQTGKAWRKIFATCHQHSYVEADRRTEWAKLGTDFAFVVLHSSQLVEQHQIEMHNHAMRMAHAKANSQPSQHGQQQVLVLKCRSDFFKVWF